MTYIGNITRSEGDPKVVRTGPSSMTPEVRLARALGWFSIGLGAIEFLAPRRITRTLGMRGNERLVRAYGMREIASGILSLSPDNQTGLKSRVAGDGLDIVTLLSAFRSDNPKKGNVGLALLMVGGVTLLDLIGAQGTKVRHNPQRGERRSYRDRTGFPKGIAAVKGIAKNFQAPPQIPTASSKGIGTPSSA
ncbi:MAG: hypothetical protein JWQ17_493 [Tardiphaga sp.]|nr:hypothetical protein [Tardiphaga sp.]